MRTDDEIAAQVQQVLADAPSSASEIEDPEVLAIAVIVEVLESLEAFGDVVIGRVMRYLNERYAE